MSIVQKKVDEFVAKSEPFTSVDIANAIKKDGIWIRNTEVSIWLKQNFKSPAYFKTLIDVTDRDQAFLYHTSTFDITKYSGKNQAAITPDEFEKTYKKKVANSLLNIFDSNDMKTILDKQKPSQPIIDKMFEYWGYDLFTRKPGPAFDDDGVFQGTDLDLACFLFALAERGAVINLPEYEGRRPKQITAGEMVVSKNNRHGKVISILANKENFAFSIRINDMNVMTTDSVGNFRSFMVVDMDGTWYDGWKNIEFMPDAKENDFIQKYSLMTGNTISFKNFIHPNRWTSFYGQYYYLTKVLIDRLTDEAKYWKKVATDLRATGVVIPGNGGEKKEWPKKTVVGTQDKITIKAFEAEVNYEGLKNDYVNIDDIDNLEKVLPNLQGTRKSDILKAAEERSRLLSYTIVPKLRFFTRATEYAFYFNSDDGSKKPAWIKNIDWDRNFVMKGKKKVWNNLELSDKVSIRYRAYDKTEIVSGDDEE